MAKRKNAFPAYQQVKATIADGKTSLRQALKRAGISPTTFYHYDKKMAALAKQFKGNTSKLEQALNGDNAPIASVRDLVPQVEALAKKKFGYSQEDVEKLVNENAKLRQLVVDNELRNMN